MSNLKLEIIIIDIENCDFFMVGVAAGVEGGGGKYEEHHKIDGDDDDRRGGEAAHARDESPESGEGGEDKVTKGVLHHCNHGDEAH